MLSVSAFAEQGVVNIPLKTFTKPALNLVDEKGKPLYIKDLVNLEQSGKDLSTYQPTEDKYWQNQKYSAIEQTIHNEMPNAEEGVTLDSYMGANRELGFYSIVVKPSNGKSARYGLTLGLEIHASLLKSGLLRKLGYFQQSPKHYSKIKLNFNSKEDKELFIKRAFCEEGPNEVSIDCLSLIPFKTEGNQREFLSDAGETALYVHGCYLEKMDSEIPSLFDGLTPANTETIPFFSQARQFRGLLVPFVIADVQESVNRFGVEAAVRRAGVASINYAFSGYFSETSYDDVRWMLRRITNLTEADWDEIVTAAQYPKSFHQLIKSKMLRRTQNLLKIFFEDEAKALMKIQIPDLRYTSDDGYVAEGRVTTEYIPGYPQRFSHGPRKSPFESGDFIRYLTIKTQSSAIGAAITRLSKDLDLQRNKIDKSKTRGFRFRPDNGIVPLGSAHGHEYGINLSASRMVTTGTYYGSDAAVQLVDNVSLSAGLGLFRVTQEFTGIGTITGGNVGYNRTFSHVTPLQSMKETKDIDWKDLYVPSKLDRIASPLKDGKLAEFFENFKHGEVFTITDSVAVGANVGFQYGIEALIGYTATTIPTLGITGGVNGIILRQTQITRTTNGFQVFIRDQNSKAYNVAFDLNYFINLMSVKHETLNTDLQTDAFVLNANTDFVTQVDAAIEEVKAAALKAEEDPVEAVEKYFTENPELAKRYKSQTAFIGKLSAALRGLIFQSSTDALYGNFKRQVFNIEHGLNTKEIKTKLLWWRWSRLQEEHLLKILKPSLTPVESGIVENKPIEVVTYQKGAMSGRDILGFGLEVIDYGMQELSKDFVLKLSQDTQNPSQMPFGRAQWHIVRTDTELTQDREGAAPSVAVLQNVWGGWSLKKKQLDEILARLKNKLKGTEFENEELIPEGRFDQVKKIDFFRITENISIMPSGLDRIKALIINPDATGVEVDKPKFLEGLVKNISEIGKHNKARIQDKVIFKNIMSIIGSGDEKAGEQIYINQCKEKARQRHEQTNKHQGFNTVAWLKGSKYECLESWTSEIISLARKYVRSDLREQNRIMTDLIYTLEQNIPLPVLMQTLGKENYLYFIEITGFRVGDEDADEGVTVSSTLGEPAKKHPYSNGLISYFAGKAKISVEFSKSQASFQ